ncbi:MAG: ABC transporter permease [Mycoplasma sp.]
MLLRTNTPSIKRYSAKTKKVLLLLPFVIITLLFVAVPLVLMVVKSFVPVEGATVADNWKFIDGFIFYKIIQSLIIAFLATFICVLIAYPFSYFLVFNTKKKSTKAIVILLVTAPIWMSFLVKIVGLKTMFDVLNGTQNSTYGNIYTVIGLVYIYIPFMILPIYNVLSDMPKNLIYASRDLGRNGTQAFFSVVLPYTKSAFASGITLVFLPALTTVAVPQFMNGDSSGSMIGDIIMSWGQDAQTSELSLARASTLSLLILILIFGTYVFYLIGNKIYKKSKFYYQHRNGGIYARS